MPVYLIAQPSKADTVACVQQYGTPQLLVDLGNIRLAVQLSPGGDGAAVMAVFMRELSVKAQWVAKHCDELMRAPKFRQVQEILDDAGRHALRDEDTERGAL